MQTLSRSAMQITVDVPKDVGQFIKNLSRTDFVRMVRSTNEYKTLSIEETEQKQRLDKAYQILEAKRKSNYQVSIEELCKKMDDLSDKAVKNGMTPEILEDILNDRA